MSKGVNPTVIERDMGIVSLDIRTKAQVPSERIHFERIGTSHKKATSKRRSSNPLASTMRRIF
jgi:hypothetical protein